jgi:hypothetical protein
MFDNTPNLQTLLANSVGYAQPVEDANNTGDAEFAAVSGRQNLRNGKITFECIAATPGSEQFQVSTMTERGIRLEATNYLYVDQTFRDSVLGLNDFTIRHKVTEVGETSAVFSQWLITGIDADNSDNGQIYWKWDSGDNLLKGYSDAARTNLVIQTSIINGGPAALHIFSAQNNSGLAGSVYYSGGVMPDPYQFSTTQTFFAVGDKIYMETFNDYGGYISTFFARNLRYEFPTVGISNTIPDAVGNRGFGPGFGVLREYTHVIWT